MSCDPNPPIGESCWSCWSELELEPASASWSGETKFPVQLPKTLTTVSIRLELPAKLLLTKFTRLAITLVSPVLIVVLPPVLPLAWLWPVLASRLRLLVKLAVLV